MNIALDSINNPVISDFDQHIGNIVHSACKATNRPMLSLADTTQIVEYKTRQFYKLHRDNGLVSKEHLNRHATCIIYLNSLESHDGGETAFPYAIRHRKQDVSFFFLVVVVKP